MMGRWVGMWEVTAGVEEEEVTEEERRESITAFQQQPTKTMR